MRFRELLTRIDHRPWPPPRRTWLMEQVWNDLLFLHWPMDPRILAQQVPDVFEIDTFDGSGWLGVVPFWMSGIRRRGWPAVPGHHCFGEINVRTYVKWKGQPGVWFLSLDAANYLAVQLARAFFHLPYFHARINTRIRGDDIEYQSNRTGRRGPSAEFWARYRPTGDVELAAPGTLEHWLTERYRLFAVDRRNGLWAGDIHHLPWPLQAAQCEIERNTMSASHGLALPADPSLIHFSRRLDVVVWSLERLPL